MSSILAFVVVLTVLPVTIRVVSALGDWLQSRVEHNPRFRDAMHKLS